MLAAFSTDLGAVIGDLVVEPDQNEITAAMALLKDLPLDGAVITGDAIFTRTARSAAPSGMATATICSSSRTTSRS
ncbi:MAG: hypothetical protein KBA23_04020 [Amaricoccus sp.]|nr:hypothetical protein [Amaricoccus sp.]